MKRILCLLALVLALSGAGARAETGDGALCGEVTYPQWSTAETASFVLRYRLPQVSQDHPQYGPINGYFESLAQTLAQTVIPEAADGPESLPEAGEPPYYVNLDTRITADNADFLSVLCVSQEFSGNALAESWDSVVFALNGIYAGQPVTLPQAMGLEQEGAEQGEDIASDLVYGLVWQIVRYEIGAMQKAYFPDLTEEDIRVAFAPQEDFYLDGDGNFVFYIQAGRIAGEVEGVLSYPFSMAELLSAAGQGEM